MGSVSATRETFGRLRDAQMQLGINVSAEDAYPRVPRHEDDGPAQSGA